MDISLPQRSIESLIDGLSSRACASARDLRVASQLVPDIRLEVDDPEYLHALAVEVGAAADVAQRAADQLRAAKGALELLATAREHGELMVEIEAAPLVTTVEYSPEEGRCMDCGHATRVHQGQGCAECSCAEVFTEAP